MPVKQCIARLHKCGIKMLKYLGQIGDYQNGKTRICNPQISIYNDIKSRRMDAIAAKDNADGYDRRHGQA